MNIIRKSILGRLMGAFLAVAVVLVALGAISINRASTLHDGLSSLSNRNVVPLNDLRIAEETSMDVTLSGLAMSGTDDPAIIAAMLADQEAAIDALGPQLEQLVTNTPAELRTHSEDIVNLWATYLASYLEYQDNFGSPNEAELNEASVMLFYDFIGSINEQADRLLADADAQGEAITATYQGVWLVTLGATVIGVLLALFLGYALSRYIRRRTTAVITAMKGLAEGDLSSHAPVMGADEFATMATAVNDAIEQLRDVVTAITSNSATLNSSSENMTLLGSELAESASSTDSRTHIVVETAQQVAGHVQAVAAGSEQMMASINEISSNASEAASVTQSAMAVSESANTVIGRLGDSSEQIGAVLHLITSIAEQTNLLALNATIESARAGDAGKGFAVVANEVKELAQQTAQATESISQQIDGVQSDTREAATTITEIGEVIGRINDYTASIASAVEQQTATTSEMSRSAAEAALGTAEITSNLGDVSMALSDTVTLVDNSRRATSDLSAVSHDLRELVRRFQSSSH